MGDLPMPEFSVRTERHGPASVVIPTGELDVASAPALERALAGAFEDPAPRVVLDLRELEFVDSSGLRTLLIAHRQAVAARKDFALVAGHRGLERTLEIAGVRGIFEWTSPTSAPEHWCRHGPCVTNPSRSRGDGSKEDNPAGSQFSGGE